MEENLTTTRLLVRFDNSNADDSREQTMLELALQYEIIPLSKFKKEKLSFSSNDFISAAFLNDLVSKGYNDQFVSEAALRYNVASTHIVTCITYIFESSNTTSSLYDFLNELLIAGFNMNYQLII